jgi:hypothetical protein
MINANKRIFLAVYAKYRRTIIFVVVVPIGGGEGGVTPCTRTSLNLDIASRQQVHKKALKTELCLLTLLSEVEKGGRTDTHQRPRRDRPTDLAKLDLALFQ